LRFDDGLSGGIDRSSELEGEVFEPLRDPSFAPESLHARVAGEAREEPDRALRFRPGCGRKSIEGKTLRLHVDPGARKPRRAAPPFCVGGANQDGSGRPRPGIDP
jgi:hypothetical protein